MVLTPEQVTAFGEAAKPLIKFMAENFHPHTHAVVDSDSASLHEASCRVKNTEFIKD
jgi:hypothetical protein